MSAKLLLFVHIYKIIVNFSFIYAYILKCLFTFAADEI